MSRREFSLSVKKAAKERAGDTCECGCGRPFTNHPKERPHYDHRLADNLGGTPTLDNCAVIRIDCHKAKTGQDMNHIAKARRGENERLNLRPPRRKIPGRNFKGEPT
jgi:hypothetical protein